MPTLDDQQETSAWYGDIDTWEMLSYIVTVVAMPFAIFVFWLEQRKERQNEEEELYQRLSDEYAEFCKLLLQNADLELMSREIREDQLSTQQIERKKVIFDILVSLFERAYILVYEENMTRQTRRLWASWHDYMHFWCRRRDFRTALPNLLEGEDPDFEAYMRQVAKVAEGVLHQNPPHV